MWNSSGFGGGGFLEGTFDSPDAGTGEKKQKERRAENVVPVTIRQILKSGEDLKVGDITAKMVTFVALVKNVDVTSAKITYEMEDTTGKIDAVVWIDSSSDSVQPVLNSYARVYGSLRDVQGKRYIMVFNIHMIEDLNELTSHLLEVIDVSLSAPLLGDIDDGGGNMSDMGAVTQPLPNSMMNMNQGLDDGLDAQAPTDPKQRMVFKVIWDAALHEEGGVDVPFIAQKLRGKMNLDQVRGITDFLLQEGFVFSTIDDEHFTVTR